MIIFLLAGLVLVHSRVSNENIIPKKQSFSPLVLGGERAGVGRLSFMASLSLPPAKDKKYHFCGGALISPTHVLTAAHCLDGTPFEVRFGSDDLSMREPSSEVLAIKRTIIHPEFDMFTMANDIAIVELSTPSTKQPVFLSGWVTLDSSESRGIIAGWGAVNPEATKYPDTMFDASVPIVSLDQCFRLYGHTLVDTTKLCISVTEGKDTCSGDSGGPLFTAHPSLPGRYVQLGVVSWGSEPCGKTPAVYIRVAYYTAWISSVIPSLGRPLTWFDATNPATFDLVGPSPTPILQSSAPTPPKFTPFPTRRIVASQPTPYRPPTSQPPTLVASPSPNVEDCSCTQEKNRWGSSCDTHDNDPLGAWCWVGDSCSSAVLTWWGAKFVYCIMPEEVVRIPSPPISTTAVAEILLAQNWSSGIPDTWRKVDRGDYMAPSSWDVSKDSKQPVLRQSSNIMVLEPRADLPKLGTHLVYIPGIQWTDYELSLNLASTDNDMLGVMFRYLDEKNYYRFSMDRQSPTASRRLVRCVDGTFTLLASDDVPYTVGLFYLVTVTVQQSHIQVMINGQSIFDVVDEFIPAGSIALYSWANQDSIFDSVLVCKPGSVATRKSVQPIYGRAVSSQEQLHDFLDRLPETTNEEGDYNFDSGSSSPQALTMGLVISLVIVLILAGGAAYMWKKRRRPSKDIEQENEQGEVTRIKVIRSPPPQPVDLDVQETCDSPTSRTSLQSSPPPLPAWPVHRTTPERNAKDRSPDKPARTTPDFRSRSPASHKSPFKTISRLPTQSYQPPVTHSLKRHQSARLSPQKTPATLPRNFVRRQDPLPQPSKFGSPNRFLEASSNKRVAELRQRPPRSPETTPTPSSPPRTSPEIIMPSPMSLTPELPAFASDFCLPEVPKFSVSPPSEEGNVPHTQREETENSKRFVISRSLQSDQSLELSPLEPDVGVRQPPIRHRHQQEVWEEIRFGDESEGSEDGLMEYFDER